MGGKSSLVTNDIKSFDQISGAFLIFTQILKPKQIKNIVKVPISITERGKLTPNKFINKKSIYELVSIGTPSFERTIQCQSVQGQ